MRIGKMSVAIKEHRFIHVINHYHVLLFHIVMLTIILNHMQIDNPIVLRYLIPGFSMEAKLSSHKHF